MKFEKGDDEEQWRQNIPIIIILILGIALIAGIAIAILCGVVWLVCE